MAHLHRHHLHRRQADQQPSKNLWDDVVDSIESIAKNVNPFNRETSQPDLELRAPATIIETVFVTMDPTFTGEIGGFSTVTEKNWTPTTTQELNVQSARTTTTKGTQTTGKTTIAALSTETEVPDSLVPTKTTGLDTTLAIATSQATKGTNTATTDANGSSTTLVSGAASTASTTPASEAGSSSSESADTSVGTKAGIAFGILGGVLVLGLLIFLLFNRRRKQQNQRQQIDDDEKINAPMGGVAVAAANERPASIITTRTSANAPRLSLRPVTQFMPTFGERRSSKGAAMALAMTSPTNGYNDQYGAANKGGSMWERPGTSQSENPFGDHNAARAVTPTGQASPSNPFDAPENVVGMATSSYSPPNPSPMGVAAAGVAVESIGLTRKASTRQEAPAPLDLTLPMPPTGVIPPSPAGTEFSLHSIAPGQSPGPSQSADAIAADGGPATSAVHRVQLDFNPTLEDEMGIKAGQLVRMLHEYDDGWALCIRLDRSEQGVVPRTCLSTRPVKPRPPPGQRPGPPVNPNGQRGPPRGPPGPGQRPMTPQGRPMTPQGGPYGRPESPAMRQMRPQSPANGRPMSPYGGGQPQSPGPRQQRPPQHGPQGSMGRKPVPGQAY